MGPCISVNSNKDSSSPSKQSHPNSQTNHNHNTNHNNNNILNPNSFQNKTHNPHSIIENIQDRTIIKTIKQINGDAIRLQNNTNSIIIILDYSAQIEIQDCTHCHLFLAPCKGSIIIRNCSNMNIVSASAQVRITNVTQSNFFVFTPSLIAIESSKGITLGSFFIEYMELPEMFQKAKLNIWENIWSEYHLFTKDSDVSYATEETKQCLISNITPGFRDIYVNMNQFQYVPYAYGWSLLKQMKPNDVFNYANLCIVFNEEDCIDSDVLKVMAPDELSDRNTKLVQTMIVKERSEEFNEFKLKVDQSDNEYLMQYFALAKNKTIKTKKSNVNSMNQRQKSNILDVTVGSITYKWLNKGEMLFLWLVNDKDNFNDLKDYAESTLDANCAWILKEDLRIVNEKDYSMYLQKLFKLL